MSSDYDFGQSEWALGKYEGSSEGPMTSRSSLEGGRIIAPVSRIEVWAGGELKDVYETPGDTIEEDEIGPSIPNGWTVQTPRNEE
jgi:hypothetical protein